MLDKIEALRKKPKHIRNRYAFWIAFSISLVIALIWAITISARFLPKETVPQEHADESGSFSRNLTEITLRFKEIFSQMRTRVDYTQEEKTTVVDKPSVLDLNALIASSSQRKATSTYIDTNGTNTKQILITATTSLQATSSPKATTTRQ